ncbi:TPA: plasmid mobilization relaxosome protein MobC [Streptococcus equi subsp. zooepidemicus]|uniref:Mobilization protein n=1 Tax=Streptococcus equi subsp. ruminatorum CECT 5772 TaxID=1051981 RepID=A0A922T5A9_9STRE|nr:plasmid mobilization relaxosome protein MobC [Streptococcus equi]HEL0245844.1 plasmid mobilization relaxosome protein MobC [Streptococcus equi subsp. zooepidemicus]HEL1010982.1 plasmid mobilization relaxosome protein MobC [Streptococcus equi subsp. ruminatorum]KED03941.1 putative mobilization protein [Streptococcus equi subsp. ruminatorum CECT 5772]HEL0247747.1 plasmid mobilization relaxosome protein MobC [Streptococcus equi subsp. zooepidemicus]HEL1012950.1 plasmid mobilization relaxosome 
MSQTKEKRKRYIQKLIRLTPEENEQIKRAMEQMDAPSFQYYAKNQLVQGKLVQIDFLELKNLRVAVNRIGGNINQIAKHANENQAITPEELLHVLDLLSDLKEMVATKLSSAEKKSLQERKEKEIRIYDEW